MRYVQRFRRSLVQKDRDEAAKGRQKYMDKRWKTNIFTIILAAIALAVVLHWNQVAAGIGHFLRLIVPLFAGIIIAFVLNVPIRGVEQMITKLENRYQFHIGRKVKRSIGIGTTIVGLIVVLVFMMNILIPNIIEAVTNLIELTKKHLPGALKTVEEYGIDTELIRKYAGMLDMDAIVSAITKSSGNIAGIVSETVGKMISFVIGFIIAVYIVVDKETFGSQLLRVLRAYLPDKTVEKGLEVAKLIDTTYTKFLTGQCIEAVIIGLLMTIGLSICRIPYAIVIGVLTSILSFIPFVGSFIACFAGALFILVIDPWMALLEIVVFQIIQFIEGQFIYPRVVGNSVGLPALFTLLAALFGGKFFGLLGMIFFIPLTAVVYSLVGKSVQRRTAVKEEG